MTTPISARTFGLHEERRAALAQLRSRLDTASAEMTTGLRSDVHATAGGRAAQAISLRAVAEREEGQSLANGMLMGRLDTMAEVMGGARAALADALAVALPNKDAPGPTVAAVGAAARAAYDSLVQQLGASYGEARLFAGIGNAGGPLRPWTATPPGGGPSPEDAMRALLAPPPTDAASAAAAVARVEAAFDPDAAGNAYETAFYDGTPRRDASGQPVARAAAGIGGGSVLDYGVQANDPAFVSALQGLAMLAALPPDELSDPDAYGAWVGAAVTAIEVGVDGIRAAEVRLGGQQARLESRIERQATLIGIYEAQSREIEAVDPFEAANRVVQLSNTLEASYAATATITSLSFLDFMR